MRKTPLKITLPANATKEQIGKVIDKVFGLDKKQEMHSQTKKFMEKSFTMKKTKVTLPLNCKCCNLIGRLTCTQTTTAITFHCAGCGNQWTESIRCDFEQIPTLCGKCLCTFHGYFSERELKTIKCCAFKYSERKSDEWGFYKGRHFYTAWNGFGKKPRVIIDKILLNLVERVQKACKPGKKT